MYEATGNNLVRPGTAGEIGVGGERCKYELQQTKEQLAETVVSKPRQTRHNPLAGKNSAIQPKNHDWWETYYNGQNSWYNGGELAKR
jgi:hypothetical protein